MISAGKIKVLIVDDIDVIVLALSGIINSQPDMEVYASASDPYGAVKIINRQKPDVIILDIQMPKMDGITFLRKLMNQHPMPVIMFSSIAKKGSVNAIKALQLGAVSILPKPQGIIYNDEFAKELIVSIRNAYSIKDKVEKLVPRYNFLNKQESNNDQWEAQTGRPVPTRKIIAIGASTGGTQAIHYILKNLPPNLPGIVIVQHMPGDFTRSFAENLNRNSLLNVFEARSGTVLNKGDVAVANGFFHLKVKKASQDYVLILSDEPPVNRHRPSVDVLFNSVAHSAGPMAMGILLTGMGDDGAKGLLNIRNLGGETIAQSENSAIVFGMPRAAIALNAAIHIMSLEDIVNFIKISV